MKHLFVIILPIFAVIIGAVSVGIITAEVNRGNAVSYFSSFLLICSCVLLVIAWRILNSIKIVDVANKNEDKI